MTQWLIISVIGHVLNIENVGLYATALGVVVSINIFFNFGIRQLTYSSMENEIENLVCYVVILQIIGFFITVGVTYFLYSNLVILCTALYLHKIIETLSEYAYGIYQRTDNHKKIAISRVIRSSIYTITFIIVLKTSDSIELSAFAMFIANLICLTIIDWSVLKSRGMPIKLAQEIYFTTGFPLGITAILLSLRTTSPRFFVEEYMGLTSVGVLVSYLYIINASGMVVQSLAQVIAPKISRFLNSDKDGSVINVIALGYIPIFVYSIIINAIFMLNGELIMKALYGDSFVFDKDIAISIVALTYITYLGSYLGYCTTAVRVFSKQPVVFAILLIVNIVLVYYSTSEYTSLTYVINSMSLVGMMQIILLMALLFIKLRSSTKMRDE
ncbi:oligosaccharide flippase family protein [Enterovibrio norvegicus]|uniref:oligosaccharide flippase family protein n=1 Tax=Enterovibrio norvegicus TaxID=188144 RepID=UPI001F528597|nr:oligosaccharide flippase family protein [Enterovibrio norvegicus]